MNRAEALYQEARGRLRTGEYGEALEQLELVLEMRPEWPEAYSLRGVVREASGDLDGSIQDYSRALGLSTRPSSNALMLRGLAFSKRRLHGLAEGDFAQALEGNDNAELFFYRGRSRYCMGRYRDALDDADQAIGLESGHRRAFQLRCYSWFALGQMAKAVKDFLEWKKLAKSKPAKK